MIYNHLKYVNKTHVVGRIDTLYRVVMEGFFRENRDQEAKARRGFYLVSLQMQKDTAFTQALC